MIKTIPIGWQAFELNVLRRHSFSSLAMPFTVEPKLGYQLKKYGVRVLSNDLFQSAWTSSLASIQNNSERLSDEDVATVLEDVYVPGNRLSNPELRNWFSETDAWWFDNVRLNLDRLSSPFAFAIAADLAMAVGDYVRSFTEETRELRQPLSVVYRRLWTMLEDPVNNGQNNACQNKGINEFIAESHCDVIFLRLPQLMAGTSGGYPSNIAWKEEWLRGGIEFWPELDRVRDGKLGMPVETKTQYLQLLEDTLKTSRHIKKWAISHIETGFISTQDIIDVMGRKVEAIYTKDFSELTGSKAVIITATVN